MFLALWSPPVRRFVREPPGSNVIKSRCECGRAKQDRCLCITTLSLWQGRMRITILSLWSPPVRRQLSFPHRRTSGFHSDKIVMQTAGLSNKIACWRGLGAKFGRKSTKHNGKLKCATPPLWAPYWPDIGRPEGRFHSSPDWNPAEIRPGNPGSVDVWGLGGAGREHPYGAPFGMAFPAAGATETQKIADSRSVPKPCILYYTLVAPGRKSTFRVCRIATGKPPKSALWPAGPISALPR